MNRLIFNEGGQPVFLDDLQTLQDNHFDMWRSFLKAMTSGAEAFLLEPVSMGLNGDGSGYVGGGVLVVDGMLCPFEGITIDSVAGRTVFVILKRQEADQRVFEDGQARNCAETVTARLGTDPEGADKAYELEGLKCFTDLLSGAVAGTGAGGNVAVTFLNGYTGSVDISPSDNFTDTELRMAVSSARAEWDPESLGLKGMLFLIEDAEKAAPFRGKHGKPFEYGGRSYRIAVAAEPAAPVVSIEPGDGKPGNFYEESYEFPLIPVTGTFKASEFQE